MKGFAAFTVSQQEQRDMITSWINQAKSPIERHARKKAVYHILYGVVNKLGDKLIEEADGVVKSSQK